MPTPIQCPSCQATMTSHDFGGVEVDVCEAGCRGLWFDWDELPKLDEPHEGFGRALEEAVGQPPSGHRRGRLTCPKCQLAMHEHRYPQAPAVIVDECYACRGLFLDPGELGQIRTHLAETGAVGLERVPAWLELDDEFEEERVHRETVISVCRALMRRLRPYGY